jgi:hypothetical protein
MAERRQETTGEHRRHSRRCRNRVAAAAAVTALGSALTVAATPGAAHAAGVCSESGVTCVPCPSAQTMQEDGLEWAESFGGVWVTIPVGGIYYDPAPYVVEVTSYTPTFIVDQQKVVQNPSTQTVTATFTSTESETVTLTESLSIASGTNSTLNGFAQTLTDTTGVTIAVSFSTSVGVNAAVSVPPDTEVVGDFGVPGYNVTYQEVPVVAIPGGPMTLGTSLPAGSVCPLSGTVQTGTATAPEPEDGWRVNNPQPIS